MDDFAELTWNIKLWWIRWICSMRSEHSQTIHWLCELFVIAMGFLNVNFELWNLVSHFDSNKNKQKLFCLYKNEENMYRNVPRTNVVSTFKVKLMCFSYSTIMIKNEFRDRCVCSTNTQEPVLANDMEFLRPLVLDVIVGLLFGLRFVDRTSFSRVNFQMIERAI